MGAGFTGGPSLAGGPGSRDGGTFGLLVVKIPLSLRISVPRMGVTSDGMVWWEGREQVRERNPPAGDAPYPNLTYNPAHPITCENLNIMGEVCTV